MFRSLWIHKLLGLRSRSVRRRQATQDRRKVHLQLEGLEDRITPTTQTFNPTDALDLKKDFDYANSHPTTQVVINLNKGDTYNLNNNQVSNELRNSANTAGITINGNGATVSAASNHRVFEVDHGDKLILNNLTVTGGDLTTHTAEGGGIADFGGYLTLSGVSVVGNAVHGGEAAKGGGIYVSGSGTLNISNGSHVDSNQAIGTTPYGGAADASGGGIYLTGGGTVSITKSSVSNNLVLAGVTAHGDAEYHAEGGGLYLYGSHVVNINGATISGNYAEGGDAGSSAGYHGGSAGGGGMYVGGVGWKVTISGSTLSNNVVQGGHGGNGADSGIGGNGGAAGGGGAVVTGGGSGFGMLSSSIRGNTVQAGAGGQGGVAGGNGGTGGSAGGGGVVFFADAPLTILSSGFDANSALGGTGGTGGVGKSGSTGSSGGEGGAGNSGFGGGLLLDNAHATSITNSSFTQNQAVSGDGGIGGAGGHGNTGAGGKGGQGGSSNPAEGGGIDVFPQVGPSGPLTLINTTLGANTAQGGKAGAGGAGGHGYHTNGAQGSAGSAAGSAFGGGMYDLFAATLINDTIALNSALAGTGGLTPPASSGGGIEGNTSGASGDVLTNDILESNHAGTGADFYGYVTLASSFDFISSTIGITDAAALPFLTGMILNNTVSPLGSLTTSPSGLGYYPELAGSSTINVGTNGVLSIIAEYENDPATVTDEIGNPRVDASSGVIDMGAVESGGGAKPAGHPHRH